LTKYRRWALIFAFIFQASGMYLLNVPFIGARREKPKEV